MTNQIHRAERRSAPSGSVEYDADVLVLGGGPAGTWAAVSAAERGARVVLADKGFCGTSGSTAAAGTGVWYVDPTPTDREASMASREKLGGYLQDRRWMVRTLDLTFQQSNRLAEWGYPYPVDDHGKSQRNSLQGPEYMRLMRKRTKQAGVTVLDHSPALELLLDEAGAVAGASGLRRQKQDRWTVRAKAVVIATGGCAFLSKTLGSNVLTGDGYLMAAEAGAEFSSMEFSNPYAISPAFGSVTKTLFYGWANFTYEDGSWCCIQRRSFRDCPSPASGGRSMRGSTRPTRTSSCTCGPRNRISSCPSTAPESIRSRIVFRLRCDWKAPCVAPAAFASSTRPAQPPSPGSMPPEMRRRAN
ncbi:FAD-binding protein [Bradyrhizobium sp. WYCCWR 13023]|uniref:FAD-binding protein n=1 Tax=Bradyrhizobium zhengyangense TaxID=2911009 RepID=A0A9X1RK41_9BRAD|nr:MULTISPECIES: FAD-binding protein [Bradyrhizobium]MCG2632603.1 FAD-binding protein [Bradyrhizobium zhengyangense]MCG2645364.1 FAD-binding protein [Bradyrhizobium zhengyangense]MCG2672836.1 FAD-binding protein [Bradyrhizobium zhengyangense]MDN4985712.1 FAD-binding protein [Bradyrhizobium sp. WYCCWR 13022]MDT4740912.1 FAD-binding protein [Bradyrhizobium sp. WYCCWR 12699]